MSVAEYSTATKKKLPNLLPPVEEIEAELEQDFQETDSQGKKKTGHKKSEGK